MTDEDEIKGADEAKPRRSRAKRMAGSTRRRQGSLPWLCQARCKPATVPGTPTERAESWWRVESYFPSFRNMVGLAAAGAFSRKS